jgi:hypothetical protein
MLTFEYMKEEEAVFIHADPNGLRKLAEELIKLAQTVEANDNDHLHLLTEEWGGYELDSESQSKDGIIINHVKIYGWK